MIRYADCRTWRGARVRRTRIHYAGSQTGSSNHYIDTDGRVTRFVADVRVADTPSATTSFDRYRDRQRRRRFALSALGRRKPPQTDAVHGRTVASLRGWRNCATTMRTCAGSPATRTSTVASNRPGRPLDPAAPPAGDPRCSPWDEVVPDSSLERLRPGESWALVAHLWCTSPTGPNRIRRRYTCALLPDRTDVLQRRRTADPAPARASRENYFRGEIRYRNATCSADRCNSGCQALSAAQRTVDQRAQRTRCVLPARRRHRAPDPLPRGPHAFDSGNFSTRRVTAVQHGQPIFNMSASFQIAETGVEHQQTCQSAEADDLAPPASLPQENSTNCRRAAAAGSGAPDRSSSVPSIPRDDSNPPKRPPLPAGLVPPDAPDPGQPDACSARCSPTRPDFLIGTAVSRTASRSCSATCRRQPRPRNVVHRPFRVDEWLLYSYDSRPRRTAASRAACCSTTRAAASSRRPRRKD